MAAPATAAAAAPSKAAVTRLTKDLVRLQRSPNPQITVRTAEHNLLEWHFVLHGLPADTPYGGGCYHGKLLFPADFPLSPPGIMMVTPSGRMEVNRRLCLSMTDFHPESWVPAWSTETILVGLLSFFISDEKGYGCIHRSTEARRRLAAESWAFNAQSPEFVELFPEFLSSGAETSTDASPEPAAAAAAAAAAAPLEVPKTAARVMAGEQAAHPLTAASAGGMREPLLQVEAAKVRDEAKQLALAKAEEVKVAAERAQQARAEAERMAKLASEALEQAQSAPGKLRRQLEDVEARRQRLRPLAEAPAEVRAPAAAVVPWLATEAAEPEPGPGPEPQPSGQEAGSVAGVGQDEEHEGPAECWICRDDTGEPLIHPCRCRGTMSGVHASCVNEWVAHSRRRAVNGAAPRCSVCHEPYLGREERPGVRGFVLSMCTSFGASFLRVAAYAALGMLFQVAAVPGATLPWPLRVLIVAVCGGIWLYKVLLLTVSFPFGAPEPRLRALRWAHTADAERISRTAAELSAAFLCLGFWTIIQLVDWRFSLPLLLLATIPFAKALHSMSDRFPAGADRSSAVRCLMAFGVVLGYIIAAPFVFLVWLGVFVYKNPRRILTPLGPTWHILFAIAAFPLCLICASNVPVLATWAVHEVYLLVAFADLLVAKRWRWRKGIAWGIALQLTALAFYVANVICIFPKGVGGEKHSSAVVAGASTLWFFSVVGVGVLVNRSLIVHYYNVWQSRNGNFTLQVAPSPGSPEGSSPAEQPAAGDAV